MTPRKATRRGFTLLEILLVMAVLVAIASVSFLSMGNMNESQRMRRVADDLRGLVTGLRVRAMEEGQTYQLAYRPKTGDYAVMNAQSPDEQSIAAQPQVGPIEVDGARFVGAHRLENDMTFLLFDEPPAADALVTSLTEGGWTIRRFEPDGTCDSFAIGVVDREGFAVILQVAGKTGRLQVQGPVRVDPNAPTAAPIAGGLR